MTAFSLTFGAVSDTGPVNYLLQIGHVELLQKLFGRVWVPKAVVAELTDQGAPDLVRDWVECPPAWFAVAELSSRPLQASGGAGERAAIALASERKLPLLCDDEAARRIARREGLAVSGTLGILQQAHAQRMIEIAPVLETLLSSTNFYISIALAGRIAAEADAMRELIDRR